MKQDRYNISLQIKQNIKNRINKIIQSKEYTIIILFQLLIEYTRLIQKQVEKQLFCIMNA